jgi:LAS superfamily LD-carboxypeptidase LdcB
MKIFRFLSNHFYVINFFMASLLVGLLYGLWYLPNSNKTPLAENDNQSELVEKGNRYESSQVEIINAPEIVAPPQSNIIQNQNIPKVSQSPLLPELPADDLTSYQEPVETQVARQNSVTSQINTLLGHYPFAENPRQNLVKVGNYYDRTEFLDGETANAFQQMQLDARKQGIKLIIISGFRSIADQEMLFKRQIERKGGKKAAAKYSAPPGHSEHHTGYALDIGDGNNPNTDLKVAFETTAAFQWLVNNAYQYGFELSFPPNNSQGVSYEPWHWRHVVTPRASQIFANARNNL